MPEYMILRLQGMMQSWGKHTYEDYRPSELFPTRSALTGLLAACLGVEREDSQALERIDTAYRYSVRQDARSYPLQRVFDYHTVKESIRATGAVRTDPIQSYREYLYDAHFTVALSLTSESTLSLTQFQQALEQPVFTPYLGRRSCPMTVPLYAGRLQAADSLQALATVPPGKGTVYSEEHVSPRLLHVRDQGQYGRLRKFDTRAVYIHVAEEV